MTRCGKLIRISYFFFSSFDYDFENQMNTHVYIYIEISMTYSNFIYTEFPIKSLIVDQIMEYMCLFPSKRNKLKEAPCHIVFVDVPH